MEPAYHDNKIEDVAEKTSNSSAELEAQHIELDESESARVLRKVDMRLVPMLALLYLVAFIDRSNSTSTNLQERDCALNANLFQSAMRKLPV
jgi:tRNA A58 N-methylase Trm61